MMGKGIAFGVGLLIVGLTFLVQAQPRQSFPPGVFSGRGALDATAGGGGYQGALDFYTNGTICYSVRACSAALRGANSLVACNTTGGVEVACSTYATDATSGDLVITAIGGLTCSGLGSLCKVKTFLNQVGGTPCASSNACDLTNATVAQWPALNTSCTNGKPCLVCTVSGTTALTSATNITTVAQPFTISDVSIRTTADGNGADVFNFGAVEVFYGAAGNVKGLYAGSAQTVAATDNVWYASQSLFNGASGNLYINGSSNTKNAGSNSSTGALIRLCGVSSLIGNVVEGVFAPSNQSANFSNITTNQRTYFGI